MSKFSKFFLMFGALAILFSAFAAAAPVSADGAKEVYQQHAQITKARVVSTGPGAVTVRVNGGYACDKVRTNAYVSGKTIYIEVWDVKNKGNDCKNSSKFTRDLSFTKLVPGVYTVRVNVNPKTGKHQRVIRNVIIPVYPDATPGSGQ